MINDLRQVDDPCISAKADVCIIGAGTAGLYLAHELLKNGLEVAILEGGNRVSQDYSELNLPLTQVAQNYQGAANGRSFGIGGTSVLWGGQMIEMSDTDYEARSEIGAAAWPVGPEVIRQYVQRVLAEFGVHKIKSDEEIGKDFPGLVGFDNFKLRNAVGLPFRSRNVAKRFSADMNHPVLNCWINALVTKVVTHEMDGKKIASKVEATDGAGKQLEVTAGFFVICAGAIESTRILLEFDERIQFAHPDAPLGKFFVDHLSVAIGELVPADRSNTEFEIATLFDGGLMRPPRLELTREAQIHNQLGSAFVHFVYDDISGTGFDLVRQILQFFQGNFSERSFKLADLFPAVGDLIDIAWWRYRHQRLRLPKESRIIVQVDIEQYACEKNQLRLTSDSKKSGDLVIDWKVTRKDIENINNVAKLFDLSLKTSKLGESCSFEPYREFELSDARHFYDVYHPTGTIRMGDSPDSSVVDSNLKVWGVENCFVSSTAVFPSAGSANPGVTHLALTARLADHIGWLNSR